MPEEIQAATGEEEKEVSEEAAPIPVPKAKTRKAYKPSIAVGNSLQSIQQRIEEEKALAPVEIVQEEPTVYEVNTELEVDLSSFEAAKTRYSDRLKAVNKMNLASILENGKSEFDHNQWVFTVESELLKGLIEREKELLPFLRIELSLPQLFAEFRVDESYAKSQEKIPYSPEAKLREMSLKNPQLQELQEIFNTRIIY